MNNDYKTYEELKEELGNNYDLFMYEINLQLLMKIDKAIECIKNRNTIKSKKERFMSGETTLEKVLEILGDKENE